MPNRQLKAACWAARHRQVNSLAHGAGRVLLFTLSHVQVIICRRLLVLPVLALQQGQRHGKRITLLPRCMRYAASWLAAAKPAKRQMSAANSRTAATSSAAHLFVLLCMLLLGPLFILLPPAGWPLLLLHKQIQR